MQYRTSHAGEHVSAAPRRGARPHKTVARVPQGHFDPDELTRRLHMVLAEQKAQAQRRQRARGGAPDRKPGLEPFSSTRNRDGARSGKEARQKPAEPPAVPVAEQRTSEPANGTQYHHVPSQAATQFTRTTTADNMRSNDLVHRLSKRARKVHLDGARPRTFHSGGDVENTALSPTAHHHTLGRNLSQTHDQQPRSPRKQTFEDELARLLLPSSWHARRNSTGNTLDIAHTAAALGFDQDDSNPLHHRHSQGQQSHAVRRSLIALDPMLDALMEEGPPLGPGAAAAAAAAEEHARVDWTQSDEPAAVLTRTAGAGTATATANGLPTRPGSGGAPKLLMFSPLLRKADSLWALRSGRRGSKDSGSGAASGRDGSGGDGVVGSPKSPTGAGKTATFFARFKR